MKQEVSLVVSSGSARCDHPWQASYQSVGSAPNTAEPTATHSINLRLALSQPLMKECLVFFSRNDPERKGKDDLKI